MTNHFHLIVHIKDNGADLSQFMCEVKTAYAKYFNFKYNTSGHFWGDRFKSTIIEDEPYMLACLRYIDRNPLNAGLVSSSGDWHYGSYNCYAKGCKHPLLPITLHPTFMALSRDQKRRHQLYIDFVDKPFPLSDNLHGRLEKRQFLATPTYKEKLSFA
jgi:putative transposase